MSFIPSSRNLTTRECKVSIDWRGIEPQARRRFVERQTTRTVEKWVRPKKHGTGAFRWKHTGVRPHRHATANYAPSTGGACGPGCHAVYWAVPAARENPWANEAPRKFAKILDSIRSLRGRARVAKRCWIGRDEPSGDSHCFRYFVGYHESRQMKISLFLLLPCNSVARFH